MKKVYLLLADGFEALEAVAPIDVMMRGGVSLCKVSVGESLRVSSSHGLITLQADRLLGDSLLEDGDALVLPGGYPGYVNLSGSKAVGRLVSSYYDAGKIVAAICGAPSVLAVNRVGVGRKVTSHSCVHDQMQAYDLSRKRVVVDGNLITGAGAGVAVEFALTVAGALVDRATLENIKHGMEVD